MGKPVLRQLTFELRFDDPQLPEENRVPIRGDRDQLEALCDAVTTYVQQFIQQPPESFWLSFSGVQDSTKVPNQDLTDSYQAALLPTSKPFTPQILGTSIYLEAGDNLTHNLYLGSLANPVSGPVIQLSLLQLFDLATALDEYSTDVMALPALNNTSSVARLPAWTPVAAVLVLALGLTPLTWQYANNRQKDQQVAKTNNSSNQQIALQPAPAPSVPAPQAELAPSNNLSPLPIGSTPPPPSATLPITPFPPNINNSALAPNSLTTKPEQNQPQLQIPSLPSNSSPTLSGQEIAIQPNPTTSTNPQGITLKRSLPPRLSTSTTSTTSSIPPVVPPPLATIPSPIPQIAPVATQSARSRINSSVNPPSESTNTIPFVDRLGDEPKTTSTTAAANSDTLFDTPQVAEAREFLRRRWQPPSGFSQTLEYSLLLGVDGSIERILPLGKAARDNIEIAGMPAIGEPFVSANRSGQMTRIRVLLSPDGKVQTFPESE
jgi:hypothetical protein